MTPDVSIIVITYNTKELIQECLSALLKETSQINRQIIVVDNGSEDGTFTELEKIPNIEPIRIEKNIGFGAANNVGYQKASGRYIVLLNSDAFLHPGSMQKALSLMENNPEVGLGGARLVGKDGSWQPSARLFPSCLNTFLTLSGLAARFPHYRFFGRADRTWAPVDQATKTDWVPGAFCIIRRNALDSPSIFDERFFMYYEEVDLCYRIKEKRWKIYYWPEIVVTHLGGETCKKEKNQLFNSVGSTVSQWQYRSYFLYFRKHHGILGVYGVYLINVLWNRLRKLINRIRLGNNHPKTQNVSHILLSIHTAWKETQHGTVSPSRPW